MSKTDIRRKNSLFGATATTIAGALLAFELLAFGTIAYYLMVPVARRSADDLANFMIVSAHTWTTITPDKRATFEYNLERHSGVRIEKPIKDIPTSTIVFPYVVLLKNALAEHTQNAVTVSSTRMGDEIWYWLDTNIYGQALRFGISDHRLDISLPTALTLIALSVIASTLFSTLILVRRVTQPLSKLARATSQLESGNMPSALPETGISELATLAGAFNRMAHQVSSLLTNRTTLLTGIAHDLRTPLTRIRLSLALLAREKNPESLIRGIELDIEHMTCLINESLAFGACIEDKDKESVDINEILRDVADSCACQDTAITLNTTEPLVADVNVLALRRILLNLLSNALRYGNDKPISITSMRGNEYISILVRDHGIGIPDDELERVFEPFYRIDKSRNPDTGGAGLGLAIAKQLADANKWEITLGSEPGDGVTATLLIPIND